MRRELLATLLVALLILFTFAHFFCSRLSCFGVYAKDVLALFTAGFTAENAENAEMDLLFYFKKITALK